MIRLSWATFRDRWPLFVGAIVAVAVGVALVQASLLTLISAATPSIPTGLSHDQELLLRDGYTGAVSLAGMMTGISAFVAVFIVASTFAFTGAQRRRDLALLRLVGARRRQVRKLIFGEALVLGTLGSLAGILLGVLIAPVEVRLLARPGLVPATFHAEWRPWIVAVSLAVGIGISVAGSFGAARRAARVRPLEGLHAVNGDRVMTVSRWAIGLSSSAGAVAMIAAATSLGGTAAMNMSIGIALVAVIALSALSPTVVPLVNRLVRVFSRLLFPRSRLTELVHANVGDGVRRSASTAAPIILLVGLVVGMAGAIGVITAGAEQEAERNVDADLVVTSSSHIGGQLSDVPHVEAVSEESPVLVEVLERLTNGSSSYAVVHAVAVDPTSYQQTHHVTAIAGELDDLKGDTVALDTDYASVIHVQLGDVATIRVDGVAHDMRVVAVLPSTLNGREVLLPDRYSRAGTSSNYLVRTTDPDDSQGVAADIRRLPDRSLSGRGDDVSVSTAKAWIADDVAKQSSERRYLLIAILGLATVYMLIAMVNAVVIGAASRRAEFAIARLTGLSRAQVVRMALWESMAVVVVGVVLGGIAAAFTIGGVAAGVSDVVGSRVLPLPWAMFGVLTLGAVVIVGTTSVLTTLAATRRSPIRAAAAKE
ncbi:MAG TPA: FtsX-like permease family protein [Mycobacterium sp.]